MNYSPINFIPTERVENTRMLLKKEDYELVKDHPYEMYFDASNYYKCKKTGKIYRISFIFNNIHPGPHKLKSN